MGMAPRKTLDAAGMIDLVAAEMASRLEDAPHAVVELWHVAASVETVLHDEQGKPLFKWRVFPLGERVAALHGAVRGDVKVACRKAAEALASVVGTWSATV